MEEELQPTLQPPVTPETLTYKSIEKDGQNVLLCFFSLQLSAAEHPAGVQDVLFLSHNTISQNVEVGDQKRTIQPSCLLPAGTRLLPIVRVSSSPPRCVADFEMAQARRFPSLPSGDFVCVCVV